MCCLGVKKKKEIAGKRYWGCQLKRERRLESFVLHELLLLLLLLLASKLLSQETREGSPGINEAKERKMDFIKFTFKFYFHLV